MSGDYLWSRPAQPWSPPSTVARRRYITMPHCRQDSLEPSPPHQYRLAAASGPDPAGMSLLPVGTAGFEPPAP